MLIVFKSQATADVLMFGQAAEAMLKAIGKDPKDHTGIITLEQLPTAIAALQQAIADDKARHAKADDDEDNEDNDDKPSAMVAPVSFAQRAVPLLDVMREALANEQPLIWEPGN